MQFCPLRARECVYECVCEGGLHAPQSDLDSLSSPHHLFSLSFFFLTLVSCRAGNLLNSHIYSELWCCPKHTDTHVRCTLYGPHRSKSSFSRPSFPKWSVRDFYSVSFFFFFFFIEVISICYSVQNIRGCKTQKWKKRKLYTVMLYLVVCVSRRVFGVPAWNHNLLSDWVTMRRETVQ